MTLLIYVFSNRFFESEPGIYHTVLWVTTHSENIDFLLLVCSPDNWDPRRRRKPRNTEDRKYLVKIKKNRKTEISELCVVSRGTCGKKSESISKERRENTMLTLLMSFGFDTHVGRTSGTGLVGNRNIGRVFIPIIGVWCRTTEYLPLV